LGSWDGITTRDMYQNLEPSTTTAPTSLRRAPLAPRPAPPDSPCASGTHTVSGQSLASRRHKSDLASLKYRTRYACSSTCGGCTSCAGGGGGGGDEATQEKSGSDVGRARAGAVHWAPPVGAKRDAATMKIPQM
jgi:hypothetical protein